MTRKRKPAGTSVPKSGKFWIGVWAGLDNVPPPLLLLEQGFQNAPPGTNSIPGEPDTIDWFTTFRYPIGGEQSTKDGLRRRQEAIEKLVAPHVSDAKTQHSIRFKGQQRYVKSIENEAERRKVWYAIEALQGIYLVQDAWQEGDIEGAIRLAYCVGRLDVDLETSERFNSPLFKNVIEHYLAKDRGKLKKGNTKLKNVQKMVFETAYAKSAHLPTKKERLEATRDELERQGFSIAGGYLRKSCRLRLCS